MKINLYYFSGSGNTKWAADKFKDNFNFYGSSVELINIENLDKVDIDNCDTIVIGTPIHAEVAPKLVMDFVNKLPENVSGIQCVLYATLGARSAAALDIIRKMLRSKGYTVIAQSFIVMPNNYHFGVGKEPSLEKITRALEEAQGKIKVIVEEVLKKNNKIHSVSRFRVVSGKVMGKSFIKFLPRMSRYLSVTEECNKCGLCLRNCPKGNITFENGQAIFHSHCMMCTRCIHICPFNAIRYKGKKVNQTQRNIIKSLDIR